MPVDGKCLTQDLGMTTCLHPSLSGQKLRSSVSGVTVDLSWLGTQTLVHGPLVNRSYALARNLP